MRTLFLCITLFYCTVLQAQFLEKLSKKAEKAAERTVEKRVERETSKKTDKALDKVFDEDKSTKETSKTPSAKSEKNASQSKKEMVTGSQFFPNGRVVFTETFAQDATGDFPANWETNSGGQVILADGQKALQLNPNGNYMAKTGKLPENYALEFDLITENLDYKSLSGSGFGIVFLNEKTLNKPKKGGKFGFSLWKGSTVCNKIQVENWGNSSTKINNSIPFQMQEKLNSTMHFTVVVNRSRLRVYIDGEKVIDLPSFLTDNLGNYIQFYLKGTDAKENHIVALSAIKITEEGEDIRSKILKGGFSTNQILFDSGSDKIKKESFEILEKIGKVLQEDTSLQVNIIGHTDSDGDDAKNMALSKARAASVMNYLTDQMKIDQKRLQFQGRGENEPIASNASPEGKAQNRRVEFKAIHK